VHVLAAPTAAQLEADIAGEGAETAEVPEPVGEVSTDDSGETDAG